VLRIGVAKVDRILHMLQWLYTYVASVYFKCFICFFRRMLQVFYLDVAYVSHICLQVFLEGCCICFAMAFQVFLDVFTSVSDTYFKYFIFLQMHVAKVSSGYFKSRSTLYML
jgi:hypothetical protein